MKSSNLSVIDSISKYKIYLEIINVSLEKFQFQFQIRFYWLCYDSSIFMITLHYVIFHILMSKKKVLRT